MTRAFRRYPICRGSLDQSGSGSGHATTRARATLQLAIYELKYVLQYIVINKLFGNHQLILVFLFLSFSSLSTKHNWCHNCHNRYGRLYGCVGWCWPLEAYVRLTYFGIVKFVHGSIFYSYVDPIHSWNLTWQLNKEDLDLCTWAFRCFLYPVFYGRVSGQWNRLKPLSLCDRLKKKYHHCDTRQMGRCPASARQAQAEVSGWENIETTSICMEWYCKVEGGCDNEMTRQLRWSIWLYLVMLMDGWFIKMIGDVLWWRNYKECDTWTWVFKSDACELCFLNRFELWYGDLCGSLWKRQLSMN